MKEQLKCLEVLTKRFPSAGITELLSLVSAIHYHNSSYITDNEEMLKDKRWFKRKFKINLISREQAYDINKGVLL